MTAAYRKKTVREIDLSLLQEPALTPEDWADFENGVQGGPPWSRSVSPGSSSAASSSWS